MFYHTCRVNDRLPENLISIVITWKRHVVNGLKVHQATHSSLLYCNVQKMKGYDT